MQKKQKLLTNILIKVSDEKRREGKQQNDMQFDTNEKVWVYGRNGKGFEADLINIEINVSAEFTWLWRLEKVKAEERKFAH